MNLHNLVPNRALLWKEWKYAGGMYLGLLGVVAYLSSFQFIMDLSRCIKYPELQVGFQMSELVNFYEGGASFIVMLMVVGIGAVIMGAERDKNTFNLMLAMPFSRQQIVTSKFVIGIAAIITIFTVNSLLVTSLMQAFSGYVSWYDYGFGFTAGDVWRWALTNIIVLAYIFTFTLFISTLSGTTLGNGILSMIFLVFPIGFFGLILMNLQYWFPEMTNSIWWTVEKILTQITVPAYLLMPVNTYLKLNVISLLSYGMIVLMIAVWYGLTVWLFNKNPMERNGEVLMFSQTEGFFKLGVTVCFALLGGVISGYVFYDFSSVFAIFGYVITGALAWWAVTRLIERRKGGALRDEKKALSAPAVIIIGIFMAAFMVLSLGYQHKEMQHHSMGPITHIEGVSLDQLLQYKDSYVGDASAVGGIVANLPGSGFVKQISLETTNTPYGIQVDYGLREGSNLQQEFLQFWDEENTKNILTNNAVTLFILVQNVDTVTFNLDTPDKQSFSFTRQELENFYGKDLRQYAQNKTMWEQEVLTDLISSNEKLIKLIEQGAD